MQGPGNWADRLLTTIGILWMFATSAACRPERPRALLGDHRHPRCHARPIYLKESRCSSS